MTLNCTNPKDRNILASEAGIKELRLTRKMDMENMRKLLEALAEGIEKVKTSQDEMKEGQNKLTHDMKEGQNKLTQDMKEGQDKLT